MCVGGVSPFRFSCLPHPLSTDSVARALSLPLAFAVQSIPRTTYVYDDDTVRVNKRRGRKKGKKKRKVQRRKGKTQGTANCAVKGPTDPTRSTFPSYHLLLAPSSPPQEPPAGRPPPPPRTRVGGCQQKRKRSYRKRTPSDELRKLCINPTPPKGKRDRVSEYRGGKDQNPGREGIRREIKKEGDKALVH